MYIDSSIVTPEDHTFAGLRSWRYRYVGDDFEKDLEGIESILFKSNLRWTIHNDHILIDFTPIDDLLYKSFNEFNKLHPTKKFTHKWIKGKIEIMCEDKE